MDSMSAFAMGQSARAQGAKMQYFNAEKIIKLLKKHKTKEGSVWLSGDKEYTETEVRLATKKLHGEDMGVDGSIWATPMLGVNGEEYEVSTSKKCNIVWDL